MKSSELTHRYLLGLASAEEVQELESRLRGNEELQDEFLLQAELDAHLRQAAQLGTTEHADPESSVPRSSSNVWKWVSGISTLAAMILLALFILPFPAQQTALAYPSLGRLKVHVPWTEQNIWVGAGEGDLATIRQELQENVPVNSRLNDGLTPLHIAALFNRKAAVELLLSEGADTSATDADGNTPLHMAAFLGHTDVVRVLMTADADPAIRNNLGFSSTEIVAVTWSSGLEAYYHNAEKVLNTTLDLVQIRAERPKILHLLSAANREAMEGVPTISIWQAAMTGNTAAIEQHIEAGTELNAREDFGGSTPLMLAAIFGHADVATILIDAGAGLELRNKSGGTALHSACFFCRPNIVELLLRSGADPHKTNNRDLTPLDIVTIEFDAELEGVYQYVYDSLNLKFDPQDVMQTRSQIAGILRRHDDKAGTRADQETETAP